MSDLVALRPGTILADEYRIERTLGAGGFGITYLAEEIALARQVTIKEYFPVDFAARDAAEDVVPRSRDSEGDYSWGLDRFLAEAQTLARFNHPNIVRVYRFFQARNTGYIVLHYEDGASLKGWLKGLRRAPRQPELDRLLVPLLDALETVHQADYLHRDIAPDNIMIRRDGQPVLIDFGSARGDIAKHSKTISALVKPGYSPYEQYATTSRQQGPWTDIYSLAATLYEAVTGRRPPDAPTRMVADEMVPPADAALSSYRPRFLAAIDKGLRLEIGERPRSVADWRAELLAPAPQRVEAAGKADAKPEDAEPAGAVKVKGKPKPRTAERSEARREETAAPAPAEPRSEKAGAGDGGSRGGLAQAFLEGWRKGNPAAAQAALTPVEPERPVKPAAVVAKARSVERASAVEPARRWRMLPWLRRAEPLPAEPGARRASPRSVRKRAGAYGRGLVLNLMLALFVAAAVVSVQDHIPRMELQREGAGVLTSQGHVDVPLAELKGHRGAIKGLAFTSNGQQIVTASTDGTLKVWSAVKGSLIRTLELDAGGASALALEGRRAATGHADGSIAVWDIQTGAKLATARRNEAAIWALAFAGSDHRVATGSHDWAVSVWDTDKPQAPILVLEGHESAVQAIAYASRGPFIATGGADSNVNLWNAAKGDLVRTYRGHRDFITAVAFDAKGRVLASGSVDGEIRLWSTYARRLKRQLKGHEGNVAALAFAPDGSHLVSGGADGMVRLWDVNRGKPVRTLDAGVGAIGALAVSPDGQRIAMGGSDGNVRVLAAALPKEGS